MKRILCALLAALLLLAGASAMAEEKIPYQAAKLNKTSVTIGPGKTVQLTVTGKKPADANDGTWESSNTAVLTVNEDGFVTAGADMLSSKTAYVYFRSAGKVLAKCKVKVAVVAVSSVKISQKSAVVHPGRSFTLKASAYPKNATFPTVTWTSDNAQVATVENGVVTARGYGTANIVASAGGKGTRCKVTVKDVLLSKVSIEQSKVKAALGSDVTLKYSVKPMTAGDTSLTWTSSDERVATVDGGVVHTVGEGVAVITAKANDAGKQKDVCKVSVTAVRVKTFVLTGDYDQYMDVGHTFRMQGVVTPANAYYKKPVWTSSDDSVISVDGEGNAKALKSGVVTITGAVDLGKMLVKKTFYVRSANPISITISAVGDVTLGGDPRKSTDERKVSTYATAARFKELLEQNNGDPGFVFKNVKSVFEKDDVTICNLEGALTTSNGYSNTKKHVFRGRPEYAAALPAGSVEVVNIKNNMTVSCGTRGYNDTKTSVTQYSGGKAQWCDTDSPCIVEKKGVKIGFIGFIPKPGRVATMIRQCKELKAKCDLLVVSFHWTDESGATNKTSASMMKYAHNVVNAGADLVLGHHTHTLAGIEIYNGKHIVYGLGNFVAGGTGDRDTFIYQQTFKVSSGFAESGEMNIIPCKTTDNVAEKNQWQPIILTDAAEKQAIITRLHNYSKGYSVPAL